jgi:hypothetical protein
MRKYPDNYVFSAGVFTVQVLYLEGLVCGALEVIRDHGS